jgi:hypothetical protein
VFTIEHEEPDFVLTRTHIFGEESDTWGIHLTTDGKEVVQEEGNEKIEKLSLRRSVSAGLP